MAGIGVADAVWWHEGMRLMPQHFQQQDLRAEQLGVFRLQALQPLHWGLLQLACQLEGSVLKVTALQALMPDGLCIAGLPPGEVLRLDLSGQLAESDGMLPVSLAVAPAAHGAQQRYRRHETLFHDPFGVAGAATLTLLQPQLQLVCGQPANYTEQELLPLLRLRREASGLAIDKRYIPPWLCVREGTPLAQRLARLLGRLRRVYATVADDAARGSSAEMAAARSLLPALGVQLMALDALCTCGDSHPGQVYRQLCSMLGALSASDPAAPCPVAPPFRYRDLQATLEPLFADIDNYCSKLGPLHHWRAFGGGAVQGFQLALPEMAPGQVLLVALQPPSGAKEEDMRRWLEDAQIGAAASVAELSHVRSAGCRPVLLAKDDARPFEPHAGHAVFRLEREAGAPVFPPASTLCINGPAAGAGGHVAPQAVLLFMPGSAAAIEGQR